MEALVQHNKIPAQQSFKSYQLLKLFATFYDEKYVQTYHVIEIH